MSKRGHIPIRMCVGCRKRMRKAEMVRWMCGPEGVMMRSGRHPGGRGVYLCPNVACLKIAQKRWDSLSVNMEEGV